MDGKQRQFLWLLVWSIAFPLVGALLMNNGSGAAASGNPAPRDKAQIDAAWRLAQPVTYENLTVFPVVSTEEADTSAFATLDDALASGAAIVTEQGSYMRRSRDGVIQPTPSGAQVNQLVLVNRGKKPLLLLAGEVVSGGKQDRIIGKDRIIPVGAQPLPLDVFCVEHSRWTNGGDTFAAGKTMVHPTVRAEAAVAQDQSKVWAAVRGDAAAARAQASMSSSLEVAAPQISQQQLSHVMASAAPTEGYRNIYQSAAVGPSVENFALEVEKRFKRSTSGLRGEHVVGVIVAFGGEVAWSDIFASSQLFDAYWSKLLRSYAVEALTRPGAREKVALEDARDFLRPATGHVREETEPGVYRWLERSQGRETEIQLEALEPKPLTLHWLKVLRTS